MARLCIRLLGPVQVTLDGQPVTHFETEKARALLAYLAAEPDRPHRRETLAEMLWPGRAEGPTRANLRHTLAGLRSVIGDHVRSLDQEQSVVRAGELPFLLTTHHTIEFNGSSNAWGDVAAFSALLPVLPSTFPPKDQAVIRQIEGAVQFYGGPFLEDVSLPNSAVFEE